MSNKIDVKQVLKTISYLENELVRTKALHNDLEKSLTHLHEPIAIVGMSGRFPRSSSLDQYWDMLINSVDAIDEIPNNRWDIETYFDPDPSVQGKMNTRWGGFIENVDQFDPLFFDITPKEAEQIDPQHRLFMTVTYEALEDAGETLVNIREKSVAVFAGLMTGDYGAIARGLGGEKCINAYETIGNEDSFLAGRLSYWLGIHGPSMVVSTACSSSLVSVHLACNSLRNGECEMAIAGGVNLILFPYWHIASSQINSQAKNGRCKTFDINADGYVRGEGCGVVVLKRLSKAIADKNMIHGVIKGSAVNHGGSASSLTAPNPKAQEMVIRAALKQAKLSPEQINYIEAHGSGTALGDAIEMESIMAVYGQRASEVPLTIGAVKTNIGHLEAASGMAGLIKTILVLKNKKVPANLHLNQINPQLVFDDKLIHLPRVPVALKTDSKEYFAGVSSFGMSGVNAHVVLEAAETQKEIKNVEMKRSYFILGFSAKTPDALKNQCINMLEYLKRNTNENFLDIAYSSFITRTNFMFRKAIVAHDIFDAITQLEQELNNWRISIDTYTNNVPLIFVFPGFGEQYIGMAKELYETESTFKKHLEQCDIILKNKANFSLLEILYPSDQDTVQDKTGIDFASMVRRAPLTKKGKIHQIEYSHAVIFSIEYALVKLLGSWDIHPEAMLGYSLGEYTCACVSGVLSLEDTLDLLWNRANLIKKIPSGKMLAVALSEEKLVAELPVEGITIASVNSPNLCIVSGDFDQISLFEVHLQNKKVFCQPLNVTHAMHSYQMSMIAKPLSELFVQCKINEIKVPYISNASGDWINMAQVTNVNYFSEHLQKPVHLWKGLNRLLKENAIVLEVGPGNSLSTLINGNFSEMTKRTAISILPHQHDHQDAAHYLMRAIAMFWQLGGNLNWQKLYGHECNKVKLPFYPFENSRYWYEWDTKKMMPQASSMGQSDNQKQSISKWYYVQSWQHQPIVSLEYKALEDVLVFINTDSVSNAIVSSIRSNSKSIATAIVGEKFFYNSDSCQFLLMANHYEHYQLMMKQLVALRRVPQKIIYLWLLNSDPQPLDQQLIDRAKMFGFDSFLLLIQAIESLHLREKIKLDVVTNNLFEVFGDDALCPEQAVVLGITRTLSSENNMFETRLIDIDRRLSNNWVDRTLNEVLLNNELRDPVLAIRNQKVWVESLKNITIPVPICTRRIQQNGTYLITGAFGGIGSELASHLAKKYACNLVLVSRSHLTNERGQHILKLQSFGSKVDVIIADVSDPIVFEKAWNDYRHQQTDKTLQINGIFHCAGLPSSGLIQFKTSEQASKIMAPKIGGVLSLLKIRQAVPPSFMVLFSSSIAYAGFLGESDYCAANSFLDAYSRSTSSQKNGTHCLSINWGAWQWDSWQSKEKNTNKIYQEINELRQFIGITFEEGFTVLEQVLDTSLTNCAILPLDPKIYLKKFSELFKRALSTNVSSEKLHPRPILITPYIAPANETEEIMAKIWQKILGVGPIGVNDGFFELGGQSLIGLQLITLIRQEFSVEISPVDLFAASTIRELSALIYGESKMPLSIAMAGKRGEYRRMKKDQKYER